MFKWLKNIFGSKSEPLVLTQEQRVNDLSDIAIAQSTPKVEQAEPVAKPKKQAKKPATKKVATVDLDGMSKKDLLAHAKSKGIKANASMNKADILAAINKG